MSTFIEKCEKIEEDYYPMEAQRHKSKLYEARIASLLEVVENFERRVSRLESKLAELAGDG